MHRQVTSCPLFNFHVLKGNRSMVWSVGNARKSENVSFPAL